MKHESDIPDDFQDIVQEYNIRPIIISGELSGNPESKDVDLFVTYIFRAMQEHYEDTLVPIMQYWHGIFIRLRITIGVYHLVLEMPICGACSKLLKDKATISTWFERAISESQEFINTYPHFIKCENGFNLPAVPKERVDFLVSQIEKETCP